MAGTTEKRSVFKSPALKSLASPVTFVILALVFDSFLVFAFLGLGLTDSNALVVNLGVFAFGISPLFHLLPLTVIVVLFCTWVYLRRYSIFVPPRLEVTRRPLTKREQEKSRLKAWKRFSKRIEKPFQDFSSYAFKRLHLADAAVRSEVIVLLIFFALSLLLLLIVFPGLVYDWAVGLYQGKPGLVAFVIGVSNSARGFGDVFAGLFAGVAPGFRSGIASAGTALTGSIVQLDTAGKYLLSQNVAAWASALVALGYGVYVSSRRQRRR